MALFICEWRGCFGLRRWTPAPGDDRRQWEGKKATEVKPPLWASGDEHMIKGMATSTVRSALLGWPDLARARCGELRRRRVPGRS